MADRDQIDYGQPVDEGDELVVEIEDIGSKGDGIARVDGFIVFVPDTEVGETVKVEIDTIGRKFAFATVLDRDVEQEVERDEEDEAVEDGQGEPAADAGEEEPEDGEAGEVIGGL